MTAPIPTVGPSPSPAPVQLVNIAGRLLVGTGNDVGIGGFIMKSTGASKKVLIRAIGPSLSAAGVPNPLQDPVLELHDSTGLVSVNDNWRSSQETEIQQSGLAPTDDRESVIIATLPPGNSTAIIKGAGNTTGVGVVEIYDLQPSAGDPRRVVFRAIGPELKSFGVSTALEILLSRSATRTEFFSVPTITGKTQLTPRS